MRISLLTCSPGQELYSSFGHTAIRVTDSAAGTDLVFNYGTFDDSDPDFYLKFTKGLMRYALSVYPYSAFLEEYSYQKRSVIEQHLALTCTAKQALQKALHINAQEENRFYNYYFHTDNCTTRARDMILANAGSPLGMNKILPAKAPTFRNLIHSYLDASGQHWSKLGIDILLGANLDKTCSDMEAMFLPDYLMKGMDSTIIPDSKKPFVETKQTVLAASPLSSEARTLMTPLMVFSALLVLILILSLNSKPAIKNILQAFDSLFFLLLGLLGVLLTTLWIIRIDTVCRNNWNLLWALPTHLPMAFFLWTKKNWVKKYFRWVAILTLLLAICWFFLPQQLNTAILPILGVILVRAYFRSK